jgi:hypothetical protein
VAGLDHPVLAEDAPHRDRTPVGEQRADVVGVEIREVLHRHGDRLGDAGVDLRVGAGGLQPGPGSRRHGRARQRAGGEERERRAAEEGEP